jgi:hypothetical protein
LSANGNSDGERGYDPDDNSCDDRFEERELKTRDSGHHDQSEAAAMPNQATLSRSGL